MVTPPNYVIGNTREFTYAKLVVANLWASLGKSVGPWMFASQICPGGLSMWGLFGHFHSRVGTKVPISAPETSCWTPDAQARSNSVWWPIRPVWFGGRSGRAHLGYGGLWYQTSIQRKFHGRIHSIDEGPAPQQSWTQKILVGIALKVWPHPDIWASVRKKPTLLFW